MEIARWDLWVCPHLGSWLHPPGFRNAVLPPPHQDKEWGNVGQKCKARQADAPKLRVWRRAERSVLCHTDTAERWDVQSVVDVFLAQMQALCFLHYQLVEHKQMEALSSFDGWVSR